jgi:hypothetical protein
MAEIQCQKAFELHIRATSLQADMALSCAAFVCSLPRRMKQNLAPMSFLAHSDARAIQNNLWNYKANGSILF